MEHVLLILFLARLVERDFGAVFGQAGIYYFVFLYLSAIIISDLPTYFKERNNPGYNTPNCVRWGQIRHFFVFIILQPLQSICLYIAFCIPGVFVWCRVYGITYYQGKKVKRQYQPRCTSVWSDLWVAVLCDLLPASSLLLFYQQVKIWVVSF